MQNTVMRSYGANAIKWQRTYQHDIGNHKAEIGYEMDLNLDSIMSQLHLTKKRVASSQLFDEQVSRNTYGNAQWSPIQQMKRSDSIIKLTQWQAKAKTRRHGQHQLCKFCGQKIGIWAHYATCAKRPNSLVDIEADIYFQSDCTATLADILFDPGCVRLIDRNYPLFADIHGGKGLLHKHITATLDLVKCYFRTLEQLIFSKKQKKEDAKAELKQLKLKQRSIQDYFH